MTNAPSKLLVADDSPIVRRVIRLKLADRENIEVIEAQNGLEAITKASVAKPDVILLDLAMPEVNGAEAALALKKVLPKVPIILLTVYADDIGPALASAVGVDMVLSKPEGLESLMSYLGPIFDSFSARS